MALPVLDGNQSATTLSSVVTGGEHIVAHSVVSLGSAAISNIASAVSGSVVTIPGLARLGNSIATDNAADANLDFVKIGGHQDGQNQVAHIVHVSAGGAMKVDASGSSVTFSQASVTFGAITGSASILNFPSTQTIAGTVTANVAGNLNGTIENYDTDGTATHKVAVQIYDPNGQALGGGAPLPISGTVTANLGQVVGQNDGPNPNYGVLLGLQTSSDEFKLVGHNGGLPIKIQEIGTENASIVVTTAGVPVIGTVTVGNSVTIGSLPAISGTVTANVGGIASGVTIPVRLFAEAEGGPSSGQDTLLNCDSAGQLLINAKAGGASVLGYDGNAFVSVKQVAGSSVTIGSLPAISGTVTANVGSVLGFNEIYLADADNDTRFSSSYPFPISGTVTANVGDASNLVGGGYANLFDLFVNESLQVSQTGTVVVDSINNPISGTVTASAPNGSLITRFGTPTTANVSFATSAVTNANRKYLLIQNVTTGSNVITVGIGFTPTTTQGIQLTAGAGITFESSYIPTGQVFILSSVTASNFTILEA